MGALAAAPSPYLQRLGSKTQLSFSTFLEEITYLVTLSSSERKLASHFVNKVTGQTLSLSYGRCIAEFLDEESLVHLGLLDLSTCVGLRYG